MMPYLRYRSNMTCLESCSVCAFTPITLAACRHGSNCHAYSTDTMSSDLIPAITILRCLGGTLRTFNLKGSHYFVAGGPFFLQPTRRRTLSPMLTLVKLRVCRWMLEARMAGATVSTSSFSRYWPMKGQACWMICTTPHALQFKPTEVKTEKCNFIHYESNQSYVATEIKKFCALCDSLVIPTSHKTTSTH